MRGTKERNKRGDQRKERRVGKKKQLESKQSKGKETEVAYRGRQNKLKRDQPMGNGTKRSAAKQTEENKTKRNKAMRIDDTERSERKRIEKKKTKRIV